MSVTISLHPTQENRLRLVGLHRTSADTHGFTLIHGDASVSIHGLTPELIRDFAGRLMTALDAMLRAEAHADAIECPHTNVYDNVCDACCATVEPKQDAIPY